MAEKAERLMAKESAKGERTLLTSLILSAPGPLVTILAAITSGSATQIADCLRRSTELLAVLASFMIFRKQKQKSLSEAEKRNLTGLSELFIGVTMTLSGSAMIFVAILRLINPTPSGNSILGLVIAFLGLLTNGWFWLRYRVLARETGGGVLATQQTLYRAKALVDLCVTLALSAMALAPEHPATQYVDAVGSIMVAVYLLINGVSMLKKGRKTRQGAYGNA